MKTHVELKAEALSRQDVRDAYDALQGAYTEARLESALKLLKEQQVGLAAAARK